MNCNPRLITCVILCVTATAISSPFRDASAAESHQWQGFYGGLLVGSIYGTSQLDAEAKSSPYFNKQSDLDQLRPGLQKTIDGFSATGSGLLGYNQRHGNVIYGIEADLTAMDYSETTNTGPVRFTSVAIDFSTQTTIKTRFSFSIRPKIGYSFDNWMVHAAAGPSISRFNYNFRYVDDNGGGQPEDFDKESWALGVSSNVGVAYNLGNGWTVRGDYVFNYFPEIISEEQSFARFVPLGAATFAGSFDHKADFQSHNVRFGLIKYF